MKSDRDRELDRILAHGDKPGITDNKPAYVVLILLILLVLPVYIWLARFLWEWALG